MSTTEADLRFRPDLLCIVPPYKFGAPPAGAAALLAYLKANGCHEFDFLDLRLYAPFVYAPTFNPLGVFGENFVVDVPDLPLVLRVLRRFDEGQPLVPELDREIEEYCVRRRLSAPHLCAYLESVSQLLEATFAQLPDVRFIGFSVWTSNFLTTLLAAAHLKRRAVPPFVVVGGPQVTESANSAKLGLRAGLFDAVVQSEGEQTLLELYRAFRAGGTPLGPVAGTMQVDGATGEFRTTPRELLKLPSLPTPSFEEMHLPAYQPEDRASLAVPYQLSRGCTDKCSFCSEWVFWKHFRSDTVEHALAQVRELKDRYNPQEITFSDSLLNGNPRRLRAFAEALIEADLGLRWHGYMRAEMDPETAMLLRRAGCESVFVGVESLSDETLALMNKRRTEAQNIAALRAFLSAGITVRAGVIPGFPGDSRERFLGTALALRDLQREFPRLLVLNSEVFALSPGQPIFARLAENKLASTPWPESVVQLAPRYADIARSVPYTVDGSNQGVERAGQMQVVLSIMDWGSTSAVDVFASNAHMRVSFGSWSLGRIRDGWGLLRANTLTGLRYAAIVSPDEVEALGDVDDAAITGSLADGALVPSVFGTPVLRDLLATVEAAHLVPPSRESPRIVPTYYLRVLDDETPLRASPLAVAREDHGEPKGVLIAHVTSLAFREISGRFAPLIRQLGRGPVRVGAIRAEYASAPGDADESVDEVLRDLLDAGLLVVAALPATRGVSADKSANLSEAGVDRGLVRLTTLRE